VDNIAHIIIAVDADKTQQANLVKAVNARKYHFEGARKGYNRPHMSEIKFYNIRCKKEVVPYLLQDLGPHNLMPEVKVKLMDVIKGPRDKVKPDAFFSGRIALVTKYILQKLGRFVRIHPATASNAKDRKRKPFVRGWIYTYFFGKIKDIDRGMGEELVLLVPLGIAFIFKLVSRHLYLFGS